MGDESVVNNLGANLNDNAQSNSSKKWIFIIVGIIAVLVIASVSGYFMWKGQQEEKAKIQMLQFVYCANNCPFETAEVYMPYPLFEDNNSIRTIEQINGECLNSCSGATYLKESEDIDLSSVSKNFREFYEGVVDVGVDLFQSRDIKEDEPRQGLANDFLAKYGEYRDEYEIELPDYELKKISLKRLECGEEEIDAEVMLESGKVNAIGFYVMSEEGDAMVTSEKVPPSVGETKTYKINFASEGFSSIGHISYVELFVVYGAENQPLTKDRLVC
jgi:hypothetical protein